MEQNRTLFGIGFMLLFCTLAPLGDALAKILGQTVALGPLIFIRFAIQVIILAPMALAIGQRALGRAAVLGQGGQGGGPGLANAGQIAGLPNPAHTGQGAGRAQVSCRPTGMGPRAAQKSRMQQTGHAQIVGVAATPGHKAACALARQALANPIVGLRWCIHAGRLPIRWR